LGGSDPTFRPFVAESDPLGSLPPIGAAYSAECFGPVATGRGKRKELEEKKEKANAKGF